MSKIDYHIHQSVRLHIRNLQVNLNLSRLRIFGSRVCACIPRSDEFPKLDHKNSNGIFLGYASTDKNIYFKDDTLCQVRISRHTLFDEAHLSVPSTYTPICAQLLQRTGYGPEDDHDKIKRVLIKLLINHATTPTISTPQSVGIYLYSTNINTTTTPPDGGTVSINTDIVREPPSGTYVRISSRSGSAFTHNVHVIDGVIDPDYRSDIKIGLINQSDTPYVVSKDNRIAQFILEKSHYPSINIVDHLTPTTRDTHGFGSIEQRTSAKPTTQGHTGQYITPHV